MQKALDQMNVQLHYVISDLAWTGLDHRVGIVDAILAGERDPDKLAELREWRIRATIIQSHYRKETIMKPLVGDYREEHIFTLRQSLKCQTCPGQLQQRTADRIFACPDIRKRVERGEPRFPVRRDW